jgi:AAA+ superfamily predicted ATPase
MLDQFEQNVLRGYLKNFFSVRAPQKKIMAAVCDWLEENFELISEQDPSEDFFDLLAQYQSAVKNHSGIKYVQMRIITEMQRILKQERSQQEVSPGQLEKNLKLLGDELKLERIDREIFGLIARYQANSHFEDLTDNISREGIPVQLVICLFTGLERNLIGERLGVDRRLISSGLIRPQNSRGGRGNAMSDRFALPFEIADALMKTSDNMDSIRLHILGTPIKPNLEWEDFIHLKELREGLTLFLKGAIKEKLTGINVLLWGPPGTGKTEFCKALAQKIKCNLYAVGEADEDGDEPSRRKRLEALRLAQSMLRYQDHNLLMFDEMDDLFVNFEMTRFFGAKSKSPSKVFTNRLFENNPVPTIWIINDVESIEESIIRRMSVVLEIKSPPQKGREAVWKRIIDKHQLDLPTCELNELAQLEVSPAVLDNAVRFAQVTGRGREDILFASRGVINAMKGKLRTITELSTCFRPELLNADMDLSALSKNLSKSGHRQFSLCLYGPPGTGKTEYVRQLANQLGMQTLVKKTSDLLGAYVGENERAIAAAFQTAKENENFLIFDEADSLLGDRRHAVRGWEISLVNEMLTWMESHPYPFACTTNLMNRLDQASLRRFTFKVGFNPLTDAQNRLAFQEFFGISSPETIDKLSNLTPGDFMVVQNKARIMGVLDKPDELIEMLYSESSVKQGNYKQIGFDV